MALIVKKWALEAGFDPAPLSRHSLRAGLATAAAKAGKSERSIMKQTGNRSASVDPALHPRCRAGRRQRGGWHSHPATERLVESFEYAVSAERAVAFVSRLCEIVRELRRGPDALIVNANLRFTRRSRALLAMQQFDRTCHIEIYTLRGIAGNRAFHDRMFDLAREFQALPHWGQVHDPALDAGALFGGNLATWQWAMNLIATKSPGTPDLFWTSFARERGLLAFTPSLGRLHPALWSRRHGLD